MADKKADLAGPGISTYQEVEKILPTRLPVAARHEGDREGDLRSQALHRGQGLNKELNLFPVEVPLIVTKDSGVNDYLDRDGSRTPIDFPCGLGLDKRIEAQVVQAATKWKRMALKQFDCDVGEGINTDMRAVRKDYFLDHDHSSYVDQWDWEKVITADMRNLDSLKDTVRKIWKVIKGAETMVLKEFPKLKDPRYPELPDELTFLHAEEILEMYPDLPRKQRETKIVSEKYPAIFIIGIGWVLKDGYPHEMRAADYDDWVTPTAQSDTGKHDARTERRHPGLEPGHEAPPRADLDGDPRHEGDAEAAARDHRADRLPEAAVPPGDPERPDPALDRRRHRPVADRRCCCCARRTSARSASPCGRRSSRRSARRRTSTCSSSRATPG